MKPIQLFIAAATGVAVLVQPVSSEGSEAAASDSLTIGWKTSVFPAESTSRSAGKLNKGSGHGREHKLEGIASYYWQGVRTASGETFDKRAMTAAHPTLPFNSIVRVTERDSGKSVVVRINDRGPFVPRSEEHTSELQSRENLVCRLLLEKKIKFFIHIYS